jgi:hypothetical protein
MKKVLMLSAMMAVVATAAQAKKGGPATYTFGTASGSPYCDGVSLPSTTAAYVSATHLYAACGTGVDYTMGGILGSVKGYGKGYSLAESYTPGALIGTPYLELVYLVAPKAGVWVLGLESSYYGIPFEIGNSGTLIAGYADAKQGGAKRESSVHATLVKAGFVRK